jgi:very-short-patch-repair endonuclease
MSITSLARSLRKNQTKAEAKLWYFIRNRKIKGKKFNRQYPIIYKVEGNKRYSYIADFHCAEKKLIIELDGGIHEQPDQYKYDQARDCVLSELGYKVIRFKNEELEEMSLVLDKIRVHL